MTTESGPNPVIEPPTRAMDIGIRQLECFQHIQHREKALFLSIYAQCGRIDRAAQAVGLDRSTPYKWLESDPEYAELHAAAKQMAWDSLEHEALRRAQEGVSKPVFYKGDIVGYTQEYSDLLTIFMLKAARPERYRDNIHITGEVTTIKEYKGISADEL